jgi:hypothetical protein
MTLPFGSPGSVVIIPANAAFSQNRFVTLPGAAVAPQTKR